MFMYSYKIHICEQLIEGNFELRVRFYVYLKEELHEDADFLKKLIMQDDAHL